MERGWIDYKRQNIFAILLQLFSWNLAMVCLKLIHACSRSLTKIYQQNFLLDTIFQEGWSMKMLITLKIFFISLLKYNYTTTEWQEKVFPKFYCHRAKAGKVMTQSLAMTISLGLGATLIPNRTRKTVWWLKSSPGVPKYIFFLPTGSENLANLVPRVSLSPKTEGEDPGNEVRSADNAAKWKRLLQKHLRI